MSVFPRPVLPQPLAPIDASGQAIASAWFIAVVACLLVWTPWSTKVAGFLVFLLFGWGCWTLVRRPAALPQDALARGWLLVACGVFVLRGLTTTVWQESWGGRHFEARLLLSALTVWLLCPRVILSERQKTWMTHGLALACWAALGMTWMHGRATPSHPIPWAAGMSFLVCVLLARCMASGTAWTLRVFWLASALAGVAGVVLSLSRGSYGLLPWAALLAVGVVWRWGGRLNAVRRVLLGLLAIVAAAGVLLSVQPRLYQQPRAHLELAIQELSNLSHAVAQDAVRPEVLDTSVGARVYLHLQGWKEILAHPLLGHGQRQRQAWVKELGQAHQSELIRSLDHLHSDPLTIWFDHGVPGLASYLLSILGLVWLAWRARLQGAGMSLGFAGLAWMHASSGLSNYNTIHNFYGVMLSLSVVLVFLLCRPDPSRPAAP